MERNQLELDFELSENSLKTNEKQKNTAIVLDFSKVKQKKLDVEKQKLYQSIISSVDHIYDDLKRK
jgi:predicted secreted protein